jgi:hypothetical protein
MRCRSLQCHVGVAAASSGDGKPAPCHTGVERRLKRAGDLDDARWSRAACRGSDRWRRTVSWRPRIGALLEPCPCRSQRLTLGASDAIRETIESEHRIALLVRHPFCGQRNQCRYDAPFAFADLTNAAAFEVTESECRGHLLHFRGFIPSIAREASTGLRRLLHDVANARP